MRRILTALAALLVLALAAAQVAVPPLRSRVTDLTGTLNAEQRQALEHTLAEFETRKGSQIALLMVPSTQPESVEQYAVRVQEAWKLGRKGVDDGVLLLVAKNDRRLRIEVGYGLEGVLPDATSKRIIAEDITPRFKQGDFYGGVRAGTDRIMRVIEGEPLPPPRGAGAAGTSLPAGLSDWLVPLVILVLIAGSVLNFLFGRIIGSALVSTVAGLAVWIFVGSLAAAVIAGLIVFALHVFGAVRTHGGTGGWGRSSHGGWPSGGGGFGGGGGGGFGGGGGGSGGGGASGSW